MSVYISAYKIIRPLDDPDHDRAVKIYTLYFPYVQHLSAFTEGWYEAEEIPNPFIDMSYSVYGEFRSWISKSVLGVESRIVHYNQMVFRNCPFFEFINFADNEGCFDFIIAKKLLSDFKKYEHEMKGPFVSTYLNYMKILENAVNCKGVVLYT